MILKLLSPPLAVRGWHPRRFPRHSSLLHPSFRRDPHFVAEHCGLRLCRFNDVFALCSEQQLPKFDRYGPNSCDV